MQNWNINLTIWVVDVKKITLILKSSKWNEVFQEYHQIHSRTKISGLKDE